MNIAFAGFRHVHIDGLYNRAIEDKDVVVLGAFEENEEARVLHTNVNFNYNTYEEILNDEKVDAVAIGDYYQKRGSMIIAALKSGKHVIADKPLCTSLEELDEIERHVKETGLQVCCMLDLRYMAHTEKMKEIIQSEEYGKPLNVSFTGQHCLDYDNRPKWYFEDNKHGGTINDIAIHGIDLVRYITGKNLTKVDYAETWNAFCHQVKSFEDSAHFVVNMDGMKLMADVSYSAPKFNGMMPTYWNFKFWCEKAMIEFSLCDNNIYIYPCGDKVVIPCEDNGIKYLDAFKKEIAGEKTMMNTFGILDSTRQVLTIQKSADQR